jgi:hypothetical protein
VAFHCHGGVGVVDTNLEFLTRAIGRMIGRSMSSFVDVVDVVEVVVVKGSIWNNSMG